MVHFGRIYQVPICFAAKRCSYNNNIIHGQLKRIFAINYYFYRNSFAKFFDVLGNFPLPINFGNMGGKKVRRIINTTHSSECIN